MKNSFWKEEDALRTPYEPGIDFDGHTHIVPKKKGLGNFVFWITALVVVLLIAFSASATGTLRDSFNTGDDTAENCRGAQWCSQTFLSSAAYTLNEIHFYGKKAGTPGTCTLSLRATSGGLPTGSDLSMANFDGNALGTTDAWVTVDVTDYDLANATTYAIILACPSGSAGNQVVWRMDSANGYANGSYILSTNSGSTWTADTTYDFMFETYGTDIAAGGGTTASTSTVTIIQNPTQDLFNGMLLLFVPSVITILIVFLDPKRKGVR